MMLLTGSRSPGAWQLGATAFIFLLLLGVSPVSAEWALEAKFSCSDPLILRDQPLFAHSLSSSNLFELVRADEQHVHAEIDQKVVNAGQLGAGKLVTAQLFDLNPGSAAELKGILKKRADFVDFPLFVQLLPALSGYYLTATGSLVFGSIFSYLFDKAGVEKVGIDVIRNLVVDGGKIAYEFSLDSADQKRFIIKYQVAIGKETRVALLYSCTYPAIVLMHHIRTIEPAVNPKLIEESGGQWLVRNASTGNTEMKLNKDREDDDFYYFKPAGTSFFREWRVSRKGGAYQGLDDTGTWQTFYSKTEVY
jgi:hypothetical protein